VSEPKQYLVAHLQQALAADERVHALDVRVKVVGEKVLLTGAVETPERRDAILDVARECCGDVEVMNEVSVIGYGGDPGEEHLP